MEIHVPNIYQKEVSRVFIQLMVDAMSMSFHMYGPVEEAFPDKVNAIESLRLRLKKYLETGNKEFLVDVANFAMIEFMYPKHPEAFFKATDSRDSPGRVWHDYKQPRKNRNEDE